MKSQITAKPRLSGSHTFIKLRLLPALMVSAVMLLFIKIDHAYKISTNLFIPSAQAEGSNKSNPDDSEQKTKAAPKPTTNEKKVGEDFPKQSKKDGFKTDDFNLLTATPEKIEALRTLSKRHRELIQRERSIAEREATILAIESRLDKKTEDLKKVQTYIETLLEKKGERDAEATKRLVSFYEKMKPAEAAQILQGIDLETLLNIMETMKEAKASAILARMDQEHARALTMELAQRKQKQEKKLQAEYSEVAEKTKELEEKTANKKEKQLEAEKAS